MLRKSESMGIKDEVGERHASITHKGDVVLLYTDGVNEALDGEGRLFGSERLKQTLATAPDRGRQGR